MIVLTLLLSTGIFGCVKEEGPAEKAGKKIDEAVEDAGDQSEEVGDEIEEATDKMSE